MRNTSADFTSSVSTASMCPDLIKRFPVAPLLNSAGTLARKRKQPTPYNAEKMVEILLKPKSVKESWPAVPPCKFRDMSNCNRCKHFAESAIILDRQSRGSSVRPHCPRRFCWVLAAPASPSNNLSGNSFSASHTSQFYLIQRLQAIASTTE